MIPLTTALDLGADCTRMKNRRDVDRQHETARRLLERLYREDSAEFTELQLLADEVGMGKTFVALAVAYSVLEAQAQDRGLPGCYQKVLVLVPQNDALLRKWHREVGEIVKRCAPERAVAEAVLSSKVAARPDELVAALRRGKDTVVIAKTSALGASVQHAAVKARLTLAALFRHFGRALPLETRSRLLKGAPPGWSRDPEELGVLTEEETRCVPLRVDRVVNAVRDAAERDPELREASERLLELCKQWGAPHVRGRGEGFEAIRLKALHFYKDAVWTMLGSDLPLVIVDEAHQWKNHKNDYPAFARWIAPRTRRALLLTATPFQLHPGEILKLLEVSDHLGSSNQRRTELARARDGVVKRALEGAKEESQEFAAQWSALAGRLDPVALREAWEAPAVRAACYLLDRAVDARGLVDGPVVDQSVSAARPAIAPELRDFVCQGLRLFASNRALSRALGRFVVRHRRATDHRVVRAGREIDDPVDALKQRPDAHVLHAAPGLEVRGEEELPLYLLMRASSELEQGTRTADLGSDLTGCYSTFFKSAASRSFRQATSTSSGSAYVELLKELVGHRPDDTCAGDARHPKLRRVVREVVERWERGEKSLIFTFRVNTAQQLHALIKKEIEARFRQRLDESLGGETGLHRFRQQLSSKTRGLYQLMLDRVLWSMLWAPPDGGEVPFTSTDLLPTGEDYRQLAEFALSYGQEEHVLGKAPDRVFLQRAAECALARRLQTTTNQGPRLRAILAHMAKDTWVESAYGRVSSEADTADDELADERGVHSVYERKRDPNPAEVERLTQALLDRGRRSTRAEEMSVVRQAFQGPSFWLGEDPLQELLSREHHDAEGEADRSDQRFLHRQLRELTFERDSTQPDFRTRALAFKAMRRALLRQWLLVRLLPKFEEREDEHWAKLLVRHITRPDHGRPESLLRLVGVFVEDLAAASGDIDDKDSARGTLYEATKVKDAVALVHGKSKNDVRSRFFQGFNSPLLPEILICGQIGQEGIDLHRHCSHVIHYDLAWNPATIEQRTGRIDRIGSRTQRLRQQTPDDGPGTTPDARLEVSTPYLAGTYDERMFEELRVRAQTFEMLLGGDLSGTRADARAATGENGTPPNEDEPDDEGTSAALGLVPLPDTMAESLRVNLALWTPTS